MVDNGFKPKILGFLCNWCAYSGADLAGSLADPSSRASGSSGPCARGGSIRASCSRPSPRERTACCWPAAIPGDCHYQEGNYKCLRRALMIKQMLKAFGIDERRMRLEWISASEGEKYAQVSMEMEQQIRELGPLELQRS